MEKNTKIVATKKINKNTEVIEITVTEEKKVLDSYAGVLDENPGLKAVDLKGDEYYQNWYLPRIGVDENCWVGPESKENPKGAWYNIKEVV